MAIRVICDECGREINVKDEFAGRKGKCPSCGAVIQVPTLEEAAAQQAAAEKPVEAPPSEAADEAQPTPEGEPEGETKSCVHCGKSIPADAVFCIHCGTHLRTGKKHEPGEQAEEEEEKEYDFFKTAPDLIMHPMDAVGKIVGAPLSAGNLKKGLILFGISMIFFTWIIPLNNDEAIRLGLASAKLSIWSFVLAAFLGLVVVLSDAIICNIAGSMFGTSDTGFANVFMAVLAVRAIIGLSMVICVILLFSAPMETLMGWTPRVIRFGGGAWLLYFVILRSYDCAPVPAIVFACIAAIVRALIFSIPLLFDIHIL